MSALDTGTLREVLRRMVLTSSDEYSDEIQGLLVALECPVAWARVDGRRLSAYVCGVEQSRPDWSDRLCGLFGGRLGRAGSQRDDYYVWTWEAPL